MIPVILNTKGAPPDILRGWNAAGSFLPASFLQAPLLPLWAVSRNAVWLPLFPSSFLSAHPCSRCPLEILENHMCWFSWALILKRTWPQWAVGRQKEKGKEIYEEVFASKVLQRQPSQQAVTVEMVTLQLQFREFLNKNDQEAESSLTDQKYQHGKEFSGWKE